MEMKADLRQVNRFLFRKQGFDLPQGQTAALAVGGLAGLYGAAPTCYLSLWARVPDFRLDDLDDMIAVKRAAIRMRAMRASLFLVARPAIPAAHQATSESARAAFRRLIAKCGVGDREFADLRKRVVKVLEERPATASQIRKALGEVAAPVERAWTFILGELCAEATLVRTVAKGGWKSNLYEYALMRQWLPDLDLAAFTPDEARVEVAKSYFAAYGPALPEDFHWWSGFTRAQASAAVERLEPEMVRLTVKGLSGEFLLPRGDAEELAATRGGSTDFALLPAWDAYMMAYQRRARYLPAGKGDRVYDASGNSTSVMLAGGRVAGVWDLAFKGKQMAVKAAWFDGVEPDWRGVVEAAGRLARLLASPPPRILHCAPPAPLGNNFLSPLKDAQVLSDEVGG